MNLFASWLNSKQKSPYTISSYVYEVDSFVKWFKDKKGEFDPKEITYKDMTEWKNEFIVKQKNLASINLKFQAIRSYYRFLIEEGVIQEHQNLTRQLIKFKIKRRNKPPRWLLVEEESHLLEFLETNRINNQWMHYRDKVIVYLVLMVGVKAIELVELETTDVSLQKRHLNIRVGKRGKTRRVPLNKRVFTVVKAWLNIRDEKNLSKNTNKLILSNKGPITIKGIQGVFRKLQGDTGIKDLSTVTLGHTYCRRLVKQGFSNKKIAELSGVKNYFTIMMYRRNRE